MWPGLGTDTLGEYAEVLIDRELYGDSAIFKAAYWFTDRYYIFLDSKPDNHISVELRPKVSAPPTNLQAACAEFCNTLVDFRVRAMVGIETKAVREALVAKAFMEGIPKSPAKSDQLPSAP